MNKTMKMIYFLAGAACLLYFLIFSAWSRVGLSLSWMWLFFGGVLLTAGVLTGRVPRGAAIAWRTFLAVGLAGLLALVSLICSGMSAAAPRGLDYIVVLGARVEKDGMPSLALQRRVNAAVKYLEENPDTMVIASGGQGSDEPTTEAVCIRQALMAAGISSDRILLEERSTSTEENLCFSMALMESPDASVGLVTNNFHVYRALLHAKKAGLTEVYGVAATYTGPTLPHYVVREAVCLVVGWLTGSL